MEFFEIGVVRDQRSKIEQVAKYVGLALDKGNQNAAEEPKSPWVEGVSEKNEKK